MIKISTLLGIFFLYSSLGMAMDVTSHKNDPDSAHRHPNLSQWVPPLSSETLFSVSPEGYFSSLSSRSFPQRATDNFSYVSSFDSLFNYSPHAYFFMLNSKIGQEKPDYGDHFSPIIRLIYKVIDKRNILEEIFYTERENGNLEGVTVKKEGGYTVYGLDARAYDLLYIKCFRGILYCSEKTYQKISLKYSQKVKIITKMNIHLLNAKSAFEKAKALKEDNASERVYLACKKELKNWQALIKMDTDEMQRFGFHLNILRIIMGDVQVHLNELENKIQR